MATGRQLVSDIRSLHKMLSSDGRITDRVIFSEIRNVSNLIVKRELNLRKLWSTDTIFSTIPCLELIEVPISECCEYSDECMISRSKYPIPSISEGNYQYAIQGVYSINALGGKGKKFKEITINRYLNLLKLPLIQKEEYYFITNGYLYITNPFLKAVKFVAYFEEDIPNEIMFPDCDCGKTYTIDELCKNPLDKEFPLPGYLNEQVLQMVSQRLLSTYFNLKQDMTSEGINGQSPNSKPTN